MTLKTKPDSWLTFPAILLAAALIMLAAGESTARPGSKNDASRRARSRTPPAATRTEPAQQNRARAIPEPPLTTSAAGKRDPFEAPPPPTAEGGGDGTGRLPPGVRGLVIEQLRLEGIVRNEESGTMIGVVTNHSNLAYFLHLHEKLYNGIVSRITPGAIYFEQRSPDSGGRSEARQIVLRLGSERQEAR